MHESEKKCIGIDVGGTSVKIGLFETDGTLLFKWEVPTRKEEGGRYILEDVAASIMALKAGTPDTQAELLALKQRMAERDADEEVQKALKTGK